MFRALKRSLFAATGLALGSLLAGRAWSHECGLAVDAVIPDLATPGRVILRTTFGLVSSEDGGTSWRYTCEEAAGYRCVQAPAVVLSRDNVLVGTLDGLRSSFDRGCSFEPSSELRGSIVDLAVDPQEPSRVLALESTTGDGGGLESRLWETLDLGRDWTQIASLPDAAFVASDVARAALDPARVYVSGLAYGSGDAGTTSTGAILRTSNRGLDWTLLPIADTGHARRVRLLAVDPADADRLYALLDDTDTTGGRDELVISHDAGVGWQPIFSSRAPLSGAALSPDGSALLLVGHDAGVWLVDVKDGTSRQLSKLHATCAAWTEQGLFVCASQVLDGFALGSSTSAEDPFSPLLELSQIAGPLECAGESLAECSATWPSLCESLGRCRDGGSTPLSPATGNSDEQGGCSCRATARGRVRARALALAGFLLVVRRRRNPRITKARAGRALVPVTEFG